MRILALTAFIFTAVLGTGCAHAQGRTEGNVYRNDAYRFAIARPRSSWTFYEDSHPKDAAFAVTMFPEIGVGVTVTVYDVGAATSATVMADAFEKRLEADGNGKVTRSSAREPGAKDGAAETPRLDYDLLAPDGNTYRTRQRFFTNERFALVVTSFAPPDKYAARSKMLDEAAATFELRQRPSGDLAYRSERYPFVIQRPNATWSVYEDEHPKDAAFAVTLFPEVGVGVSVIVYDLAAPSPAATVADAFEERLKAGATVKRAEVEVAGRKVPLLDYDLKGADGATYRTEQRFFTNDHFALVVTSFAPVAKHAAQASALRAVAGTFELLTP